MKLRALGFGVLDQIAARALDFGVLIIALRTFPLDDLALFGLATGALFIFNLLLVTPETALVRNRRAWHEADVLQNHVWSYVQFALARIVVVSLIVGATWLWLGSRNPIFLASAWALTQQFIQLAEIARLERRVALAQQEVFKVELIGKLALLAAMGTLFVRSSIGIYIGIYLFWSSIIASYWLLRMKRNIAPTRIAKGKLWNIAINDLAGFSFYAHLFGIITYGLYNVDPWILRAFNTDIESIGSYTAALKSSALFFMIPMFLQFMTAAFLQNATGPRDRKLTLARMWALNAAIALGQLLFFVWAGAWLGQVLVGGELDQTTYYELGLWICIGVFVLNLVRPLIADLLLRSDVRRLLWYVFIPATLAAAALYPSLTWLAGPIGCAIASAAAYFTFTILVLVEWVKPSNPMTPISPKAAT